MLITVFTPAYNRANLLPRLYESLQRQTFHDFEWVIVDDGSTDGTKEMFKPLPPPSPVGREPFTTNIVTFCQDSPHTGVRWRGAIRYFYQENGGKHRAINRGVKEARGELFFIADSDDWLPDDALEIVAEQYKAVKEDGSIAGVVGLDAYSDGRTVANKLPFETLVCSEIAFRNKYHVKGDMKEVFRTDVLREIPFPEIEGEKFCPEDLVWHRIARKYLFRYFNQVIYMVEYQQTGLSARLRLLRMKSPVASVIHYAEYNDFDLPVKQKLRNSINYWRFYFCLPKHKEFLMIPVLSWKWYWTKPLGWMMHINDLRISK